MTSTLLEKLQTDLASEIEREFDESFDIPGAGTHWEPTPKQIEIMRILKETPMLTDWCLRRLRELQARIAGATLNVMYTEQELEELRSQLAE